MDPITLILPTAGLAQHSCGYCSPPGERSPTSSSISYGLYPQQMSCAIYQQMIDRGWRRSGAYMYKPDMGRTCCPQYPIRLDVTELKVSKSQKKSLQKWNRFILDGRGAKSEAADEAMEIEASPKPKHKGKDNAPFSLVPSVHASEAAHIPSDASTPAHKFEVVLELASFTPEKFALYEDYQCHVHKDSSSSRSGFNRFLVESPLLPQAIPYPRPPPAHLPAQYGSYHQRYVVDGELVAMGVIDILPGCVSSVYFMYASEWEEWSLGKVSALREAALAREMCEAGLGELRFLYMGFYIHSCQKMRYKGEYNPSFLLDPEVYTWHPIRTCAPLLDKARYVSFAHPDRSRPEYQNMDFLVGDESAQYRPLPRLTAGCLDPTELPFGNRLDGVRVVKKLDGSKVVVEDVTKSRYWRTSARRMICDAVATMGVDVSRQVIFVFS